MAKVLFFANIKEKINKKSIPIGEDIGTIAELRKWLVTEYPAIEADLTSVIWAKNEQYVEQDEPIEHGDVIAIIPPVSGG